MDTRYMRLSTGRMIGAALIASWAAGGGALRAQAPQVPQGPVFKSGVELIAIDVNVVDRSGLPVRSLTPDQFAVTVDGRPRRVLSAELVDHSPPPEEKGPADTGASSTETYSSNDRPWRTGRSGRLFYLLVDQSSFKTARANAVISATRRFVQLLQPTDRIGVVAFPGPGPSVAATADHAAVRIALSSLVGSNQPLRATASADLSLAESADIDAGDVNAESTAIQRECRGLRGVQLAMCSDQVRQDARSVSLNAELQTRVALAEMQRVIRSLAFIDEPKTLVLVSAGLPVSDRSTGSFNLTPEITQLATDAAKANANLYVLHLDSSFLDAFSSSEQHLSRTVGRDASIGGSGLETLAGASGGTLLRVTNEADDAFDRVLKETAASYMLGLEPLDGDRDNKPHEVRVNVKQPGAQVRFRREFILAPAARTVPANPVAVALGAPRVATGLPVGVSTRTLGVEPTGGLRVLVTAQVGRDLPGAAEFTMGLLVRDAQGRVVIASRPESARLVVPPGNASGGASYLATLALRPGDYRLRVAAVDAEGRVGSVDHPFSVALAEGEGGLMMGDLVLLHPARSADDPLAVIPDGRLQARTVAAHLEVSGIAGSSAPTVTFGVADRVDGQLLVKGPGNLSKGNAAGQSAADAVLDLALLPPGNYMAVAIVSDGKHNIGTRFQPLYLDRPAGARDAGVAGATGTAGLAPRVRFAPGLSSTLVKTFSQTDVLTPPVLAYFASRLTEADASPPAAAASAVADLRYGRFDAVLADLGDTPSDRLSAAFLRGVALLAKGQLEPAVAELRQALRISDDFLPAAFYLGACFAAGGKDEKAVGAWQTALATEGEARIVYDVLADALLRLEDPEQTLQVLDEARGRWPEDEGFLPRQAVAQTMLGNRSDALATLQRYLDKHRTDTEAAALAIRLIYEAHAAGQTVTSLESDRAAAAMYSEWYRAAGGQNQALVDRWLAFIAKK